MEKIGTVTPLVSARKDTINQDIGSYHQISALRLTGVAIFLLHESTSEYNCTITSL